MVKPCSRYIDLHKRGICMSNSRLWIVSTATVPARAEIFLIFCCYFPIREELDGRMYWTACTGLHVLYCMYCTAFTGLHVLNYRPQRLPGHQEDGVPALFLPVQRRTPGDTIRSQGSHQRVAVRQKVLRGGGVAGV